MSAKVLVVDDEVQIRKMLRIALKSVGYEVVEADSVESGLAAAVRQQPDLLVLDLGMDSESIAAALLHDVVEDTPTTLTDLTAAFGEEVAALVDGVTKLTKIQFSNIEELQAENLRKMLLAMSRDVRVMIIKL